MKTYYLVERETLNYIWQLRGIAAAIIMILFFLLTKDVIFFMFLAGYLIALGFSYLQIVICKKERRRS